MIGKTKQLLLSFNSSKSTGFGSVPSQSLSSGISETMDYDCQTRNFQVLATGGPRNRFTVETIVYGGGRVWSNEKVWMKTSFKQPYQAQLNGESNKSII